MSTLYRNFPASLAYAYPAANRSDGGEDNSEKNLRTLTDKFAIKSFVVRRFPKPDPEYFNVTLSTDERGRQNLTLARGECSIAGYYVRIGNIVNGELSGEVEVSNIASIGLRPLTKYNLTITCVLDATGLMSGDGLAVVGPHENNIVSRGIRVQFMTDDEVNDPEVVKRYPHLVLGTIETDRDGLLVNDSFVWDKSRYSFIDGSTVLSETGKPLEEWVNDRIGYEITHLSQLNFYEVNEDGTEDNKAKFEIVPVFDNEGYVVSYDIIFKREVVEGYEDAYPTEVSFSEIEQRTRPSKSGDLTEGLGLKIYGNSDSTYNGTSSNTARADHLHDDRYVHKMEDSQTQVVKSPVKFNNKVETLSGISGTGFSINDNGSANFGGENLNIDEDGNITSFGDINAKRVFNAVWNDYAELYLKDDSICGEVDPGTVVAKVPGKDSYGPVTESSRRLVVGVCSDTYGHLLGGDRDKTEEENLRKYIPVALSGRVMVKVVKGAVINEGDLLVASAVQGCATSCTYRNEQYGMIVGKALESSDGTKGKILMQVFLG